MANKTLVNAGALRQFKHNDGSEGFVAAYDLEITDREFARLVSPWVECKARMPADETPVFIVHNGKVKIGEVRWEHPGWEETYEAFQYWDDPNDDGQCWDWDDVTHWMHIPPVPNPYAWTEADDEHS